MTRSLTASGATGAPAAAQEPGPDVETSSEGYARRFAGAVGAWFLDAQARITLDLLRRGRARGCSTSAAVTASSTGPLVDAGYDVTVYGSADACAGRVRPWTENGRARFLSRRAWSGCRRRSRVRRRPRVPPAPARRGLARAS